MSYLIVGMFACLVLLSGFVLIAAGLEAGKRAAVILGAALLLFALLVLVVHP